MIENAGSIHLTEEIHNSIQEHYIIGQRFPHLIEQNIRTLEVLKEGGNDGQIREDRKTYSKDA